MNELALIVYSHSTYQDALKLFFGQAKEYLPNLKKYLFIEQNIANIPDEYQVVLYDEKLLYQQRFTACLKQIPEKYCLLHHEDMILYGSPNLPRILDYLPLLEEYAFVKLIKGGETRDIPLPGYSDLKQIPLDASWIFSIQPSLFKTTTLLKLYSEVCGSSIWEFEANCQSYCRNQKLKGLYTYMGEKQRGGCHWDSSIYPYIATAIVKGFWNLSEYPEELGKLLKKYGIDPKIRGIR